MPSSDLPISSFITELSSASPAPGGGAAAALAAALSSSLLSMAALATSENGRYSAVRDEMIAAAEELKTLCGELLSLIDADAEGFAPLSDLYKAPKDSEGFEQKRHNAVLLACRAPLDMLHCLDKVSSILIRLGGRISRSILSDVRCAALLCSASAQCCAVTIAANTGLIKGTPDAGLIGAESAGITAAICERTDAFTAGLFPGRSAEVL